MEMRNAYRELSDLEQLFLNEKFQEAPNTPQGKTNSYTAWLV